MLDMLINAIQFIPENVSAAICYAYENDNKLKLLEEDDEQIVIIVNMGYVSSWSSVIKYTKSQCKILSCCYDYTLGGFLVDRLIFEKLVEDISEEKNVDIKENESFLMKLKDNIVRCKEKLSASGADSV